MKKTDFDPSELDRRITIETLTITRPSSGDPIETWTTLAAMWAKVMPLTGREYFAAQQVVASEFCKFRIRYLTGFDTKARINYNGKLWNIRHIAEIGRRLGLDIVAEALPL